MIWDVAEAMAPGNPEEQRRQIEATIPIGRLGGPEYLTGAVVPVDGAQTSG